mmetsp:Transcript_58654/g.130657  ORF Transcript_58654/g.130657 Transcript_58654/m.130657 type:complete len:553 (-) Transcript_58654:784-2442(-)
MESDKVSQRRASSESTRANRTHIVHITMQGFVVNATITGLALGAVCTRHARALVFVEDLVELGARSHGLADHVGIRHPVATNVDLVALALDELVHDGLLVRGQSAGEVSERRVTRRHRLRPVARDEESATTVVELLDLAQRRLVVVEQLASGFVERGAQLRDLRIAGLLTERLERHRQRKVLTEGVPAEVVLLGKLLHMLWCRASRSGLEEATAREQRHNGEHLGGCAQLEDREQVSQVVAQDVTGDGDRVLASAGVVHCRVDRVDWFGDGDVEAGDVVVLQVRLHFADQRGVVRAVGVEPEDGRRAREARALHRKPNPVADRRVLGLAHSPQVARLNVVLEDGRAAGIADHAHRAWFGRLEGLVVGAVLLSFLRHQADIGHVAHRAHIELAMHLAVLDHCLVHGRVAPVGDDRLGVFQLTVLVPHLARVAHDDRHGRVDDHVRRNVQVGDASVRVNHRQPWTGRVALSQSGLNGCGLRLAQTAKLIHELAEAVVRVEAQLVESIGVLLEQRCKIRADGHAEHDRIADLHHGRLQMQGDHQILLLCVVELLE